MKLLTNEAGEYAKAGNVTWAGNSFDATTDDEEIRRIVERVNEARTWDSGEPPDYKDAPVAERDTQLDKERATSLLKTYLSQNGFGLLEDGEQLQPERPF